MERYARQSGPAALEVIPIARPFSNFDFVDTEFGAPLPLRRIFSQVRLRAGNTLILERLDPAQSQDLSNENEDIRQCLGAPVKSQVWRFSFFTKSFSTPRGLASATDEQFLGYAIIKRDEVAGRPPIVRVYESVFPPSVLPHSYAHGCQEWKCRVGSGRFTTSGYIYAQQNGITNVCAHAACRTAAARFHPDGDMTYREMNNVPGVAITNGGLLSGQIVKILEAAGARCITADFTTPKPGFRPPSFQKYIYGSIESGYPAIVCFATSKGPGHAVPVFGHTFNEDMWVASAEWSYFRVGAGTAYVPSESWLGTFIAHDDNWGPNYCIPRHFLYTRRYCDKWPRGPRPCHSESECVAYVMACLPKDVKVNPIDAEIVGADYLFSMLPQLKGLSPVWGQRLDHYANSSLLVLRPILIDSSQYVTHLEQSDDWERNRIRRELIEALRRLPEGRVWMVELSVPEVFSANRRKLGEVLIRAGVLAATKRDFRNYLLARVPGYFALYVGGGAASPQYSFVPSGLQSHIPLFRCENR